MTKIGVTHGDPYERLKSMQGGSPAILKLVCYVKVDGGLEHDLQYALRGERSHGEWFRGEITRDKVRALLDRVGASHVELQFPSRTSAVPRRHHSDEHKRKLSEAATRQHERAREERGQNHYGW
ncbi:MAG: GIY-YIG nuclease family protein [bacterium]